MNSPQESNGKVDCWVLDFPLSLTQGANMEAKKYAYLCFWSAMKYVCDLLPRGWQAQMAGHVGKDPGYISQIFHRKSNNPSLSVQEGIAEWLGFTSLAEMLQAGEAVLDLGKEHPSIGRKFVNPLVRHLGAVGVAGDAPGEIIRSSYATPEDNFVKVPYRTGAASGGPGGGLDLSRENQGFLSFDGTWLRHKGQANNMAVIKVNGDSMSPAIPDGSVVLVDEGRKAFAAGKVFVVTHNNEMKVKRLGIKEGAVIIKSDDGITPDEAVAPGDQFAIEGRVIWTGHEVT